MRFVNTEDKTNSLFYYALGTVFVNSFQFRRSIAREQISEKLYFSRDVR